jgi:hypothetical protein
MGRRAGGALALISADLETDHKGQGPVSLSFSSSSSLHGDTASTRVRPVILSINFDTPPSPGTWVRRARDYQWLATGCVEFGPSDVWHELPCLHNSPLLVWRPE